MRNEPASTSARPQVLGVVTWLGAIFLSGWLAWCAAFQFAGVTSEAEELEIEALNDWAEAQGLPRGQVSFDHADPVTGAQIAVLDLVWPDGLQPGLTGPVAVLLNETPDVLSLASAAGFRCFTSAADFKAYVTADILKLEAA